MSKDYDPVALLSGIPNTSYGSMQSPDIAEAIPGLTAPDQDFPVLGYEFDPAKQLTAGFEKGVKNMEANTNYFKAMIDSMTGQEQAMRDSIHEAGKAQQDASARSYVDAAAAFEKAAFENGTFEDFMNATLGFTGEIAPSAIATVGTALVGTAIAALTSPATVPATLVGATGAAITKKTAEGVTTRLAKQGLTRKMVTEAVEAASKKQALSNKQKKIMDAVYKNFQAQMYKRRLTRGGIAGAAAQEYPQMSGTFFGNFADQGMTDPVNALQAGLLGVPATVIGVGTEKIVFDAVTDVFKNSGGRSLLTPAGKQSSQIGKKALTSVGVSSGAEGLAETGQTAIEVAQKFAIDDEYTRQQAKLDLATSAFAGAVGGFGMGGAATTASSITAKANELLQTSQQKEALQQMYRAKYGEGGPGVVKEPASYIKAQIDAMMDSTNKKTNVWIDVNSYDQWNTIADEVLKQYPNLKGYDMGNPETGLGGILLSADPEQIQSFKQIMELNTPSTKLLDDTLSSFLSYPRSRLSTDTHVVEVKNKDGVPVHYHQTSAMNEDGQTHLEQAKQLFGNNPEYTYELVDGETHLDARSEAVAPTENLIEDTDLDSMQENLDFREFENDFQETIESEVPTKIEDTGKVETKTFINKNQQPWSAPDENYENTQPSPELVAEARALVDPAFREEFDKNIRDNKYSRILLKRYVEVSDVYFDAERTYKIEEQDGGYVIAPYAKNPMQRAEGFESIKSDLDAAVRRAKDTKRARQSRWQIASNDGTSRAVDMPNLLNNYLRVLRRTGVIDSNQNYRQQLADTFTTLVGSLLESDNQKLTFKFDDISDATFSDPDAVVYTEEDGNLTFTLGQLFEAAREQEDTPLTGPEKRVNNRFGIDPRNRNLVRQKADELQERIGTEQEGEFDSSDLETLERVLNEGAFDPTQDLGPEQISEEEGDPIFNEMPADEQWDAEQASWAKQQFTKIKQKPGARPKNVTISQDFVNSFGVNKAIIEQLIKTATDKLNITKEIKVFTTRESENIDVGDENINKYLNERKDYVLSKDSIKGINIEMRDYDVIILKVGIDPDLDLQGLYYKRLGHEIGHSFLRTELLKTLGNPKIRAKLIKEFNKAKEKSPEVGQWQQANGMEEWASDKIGAYLFDLDKGQVLQAKNIGDSVLLRIAKSIKAFENSIRPQISVVQNRFAFSETFAEYVNGVLDAAKEPSTRENDTTYMEKAHIEDMLDAVFPPKVGEKQVKRINDEAQRIIKNGKMPKWFKKLFYDAHSFLGTLGADTGVGKDLADIFHTVSGNQKDVGFINEANRRTNQLINRLVGILRDDDNINVLTGTDKAFTKEEVAVFKEASNEKLSDAELSPKAQQVRKFLFDIYDELELSKYGIERRPNFFPRILHIQDIASKDAKRATLIKLLAERNNITIEEATKDVEKTIKNNQKDPNLPTQNDDFEIGMQKDRAKLYEALDSETLLNEGLILPPEIAILEYVRKAVRRAEYEKRGGAARVNVLVNQLPAEERAQAKEAIDAMLGNINPIKNDMWRKITGGGLLLNVLNLLGMAVFASIPDAAGPILRSRNTDLKTIGKNLYQAMGQKEGARLAKSIGTNGVEAAATTILYAGEMDMLDQWGRKLSNGWFKYTQLERWTMFTRKFAAGMGRDFLLKHAETIKNGYEGDQDYLLSERYLKELNVTADQILAAQGQDIDAHPEVAAAMGRFVDESIVRPNAAERPIWASDPNFALVWQLKSFYYAYGKNIMGGLIREGKARKGETGHIADGVAPLLFGASLLMPLTMLGWDLRERFKIGLSWLLPGISPNDPGVNYRASQSMSSGEYWFDVLDRSGQLGPFALAIPLFMEDKRYGNPFFVPILGPSAEKAWDVATGDFNGYKWLPVYGQLDTRALGR